ncbi:MAG: deoxyribonuclease IV [bacterium]|nr:deoxyribonuclease IV [bacterium]
MSEKNDRRLFGCHVSAAGGVSKSFQRGVDIGCTAIQIFSKNQKQWNPKPFADEEVPSYHEEQKRTGIGPVIIHDSYLINLCGLNKEVLEKSRKAFGDEIYRADMLKAPYIVFHPGAHGGEGEDSGIKMIAESLNIVIDKFPDSKTKLLLETTAGQGTGIGHRFEQLRRIIDLVEENDRIGICLDTCHVFAAGYDIRTEKTYEAVIKEFDDVLTLDLLKVIHVNDSKRELGSRVDRHENLGDGEIGRKAFELLVNDERLLSVCMILETPGGDEMYKKNLRLLKKLAKI